MQSRKRRMVRAISARAPTVDLEGRSYAQRCGGVCSVGTERPRSARAKTRAPTKGGATKRPPRQEERAAKVRKTTNIAETGLTCVHEACYRSIETAPEGRHGREVNEHRRTLIKMRR